MMSAYVRFTGGNNSPAGTSKKKISRRNFITLLSLGTAGFLTASVADRLDLSTGSGADNESETVTTNINTTEDNNSSQTEEAAGEYMSQVNTLIDDIMAYANPDYDARTKQLVRNKGELRPDHEPMFAIIRELMDLTLSMDEMLKRNGNTTQFRYELDEVLPNIERRMELNREHPMTEKHAHVSETILLGSLVVCAEERARALDNA